MVKHEIFPLVLATIEVEKSKMMYLAGCGLTVTLPVVFFLVSGGDQNILVDTGASAEAMLSCEPNQPARDLQSFEEALNKHGLKPEDIDIVIQTHLHHDHIGNTAKCCNARIIVQEAELNFATNPHPLFAGVYPQGSLQGVKFQPITGDAEITDGIRVLLTPGHSPGSQSVVIRTAKGTAIITGFCCIRETFEVSPETRAVSPSWVIYTPGCHTDALAAFDNALRMKELADILVPNHEPELMNTEKIP